MADLESAQVLNKRTRGGTLEASLPATKKKNVIGAPLPQTQMSLKKIKVVC